ncbi:MAG: glycosyltransferase [Actinobacteria bacterium]|nr:glycosyltransferase [Actinomycetota bacterium]
MERTPRQSGVHGAHAARHGSAWADDRPAHVLIECGHGGENPLAVAGDPPAATDMAPIDDDVHDGDAIAVRAPGRACRLARAMGSTPITDHGRVALVHDFLLDLRGAERVLLELAGLFPQADIVTAVYDERGTEGRFADRRIVTSALQRLRPTAPTFRALLPFYPTAMEAIDLRPYDLVVSSSSAWAHGVLPHERAAHVCYCHNPFRYAWNEREATLAARGPLTRPILAGIMRRWRQWDATVAQRVDTYVANSEITRLRIERSYGRESQVIHPPVAVDRFAPGAVGEHYMTLSEVMAHKRLDVAVRAFTQLGLPLVVTGDGPDLRRLRGLAGPTVRFTGRVSDREVEELLRSARALVVTATEEFGIAAVEAQASGRPVIAHRSGGVLESVVDGETGVFYDADVPQSLIEAVQAFDPLAVSPERCVARAAEFGPQRFREEFAAVVDATIDRRASAGRAVAPRSSGRARGLARPVARARRP